MGGSAAAFGSAAVPSFDDDDGGWTNDATAISEFDADMFDDHPLDEFDDGVQELSADDFEELNSRDLPGDDATAFDESLPADLQDQVMKAITGEAIPVPILHEPHRARRSPPPTGEHSISTTGSELSAIPMQRSESTSGLPTKRRASEIRGVSAESITASIAPEPLDARSASSSRPSRAPSRAGSRGGAPGEDLVDHRGRAKPVYGHKTARPQAAPTWKPPAPVQFVLGLVPGAWMMIDKHVSSGLTYMMAGLLAILPGILSIGMWRGAKRTIGTLSIDDRWMLMFAAMPVLSITTFEVLRLLANHYEKKQKKRVISRTLAVFALPGLALVWVGLEVVHIAPAIIEPAWFIGLFLMITGLVAGLWSAVESSELSDGSRKGLITVFALVLLVGGGLVATGQLGGATLNMLIGVAKSSGFQVLPGLLEQIVR